MIYPTISPYNAPYRGPRNLKDINNFLTSANYDVKSALAHSKVQKTHIDRNLGHAYGQRVETISNLNNYQRVENPEKEFSENIAYTSVKELDQKLSDMETKLRGMLKNLKEGVNQ